MTRKSLTAGLAAAAAIALVTACGTTTTDSAQSTVSVSNAGTTSAASSAAHNMSDVMFSRHMIPHHAQAIQMSDIVLAKQGIDPRVTQLAEQIKAAQQPEIDQMQNWLRQWGQEGMPMPTGDMGMSGHGDMPGMGMGDGMMSDEDMAALTNAQGVAASRIYLTQMIEHHRGAITMAQTEISGGQYPASIALARSIVDTQQREITEMEAILPTL